MNTKRYMIIIKGEIKTPEISFCEHNDDKTKWNVKFNDSGNPQWGQLEILEEGVWTEYKEE